MPTSIKHDQPLLHNVSDLINDGLVSIPSFINEDETQTLLDLIDLNYHCWNVHGYEQPRRVQSYVTQSPSTESYGVLKEISHGDINSLDWLIDKFMELAPLITKRNLNRPTHIYIEERFPSTYSPSSNENISSSSFECNDLICRCTYCDMNDTSTPLVQEKTDRCSCYVGYLTLLHPCTQFLNKPRERNLNCWELETDSHQLYFSMHCQSLVLKWGEALLDWRYRLIPFKSDGDERNNTRSFLIKFKSSQDETQYGPVNASSALLGRDSLSTSIQTISSNSMDLSQLLTIVVTTSPIKSHPSTELLERVFKTFVLAGNEFAFQCPKVIICDGCRILDDETDVVNGESSRGDRKVSRKHSCVKQALRNGITTAEQAENYKAFKVALRQLCEEAHNQSPFSNTTVIELDERHGYGFALRNALTHVKTPFVCVIQHDRTFMRKTPIRQIIETMVNDVQVKYVGLSMRSNLMYRDIVLSKYGKIATKELCDLVLLPQELVLDDEDFQSPVDEMQKLHQSALWDNLVQLSQTYIKSFHYMSHVDMIQRRSMNSTTDDFIRPKPCSLTPTLFWYDNIHICRADHYRDFVFSSKYKMVSRGGFVEDKLSPALIRNLEKLGLKDGHAKFGCYLLDDHSGFFYTGHLDGGSFIAGKDGRRLPIE